MELGSEVEHLLLYRRLCSLEVVLKDKPFGKHLLVCLEKYKGKENENKEDSEGKEGRERDADDGDSEP